MLLILLVFAAAAAAAGLLQDGLSLIERLGVPGSESVVNMNLYLLQYLDTLSSAGLIMLLYLVTSEL